MLTVGLTGGIGSGKSLIASIFRILEVPVFNSDAEGHALTNSNPEIQAKLHSWLGDGFFTDGMLNRSQLAGLVFNDSRALEKLNGIIHPYVASAFKSWIAKHVDEPYVINEAAILFESGFYKQLDVNILITCPEEIRLDRIVARDRCSREDAILRLRNQWTDDRKIPLSNYVIQNDESRLIIPEILNIHNLLTKQSYGEIR
jgi:dephospho-CoA kinase